MNLPTVITGFAFQVSALPSSGFLPLFECLDVTAGEAQNNLAYSSSGQLQFYSGGSTSTSIGPASSTGIIVPNTWNYCEMTSTISSTAGFLECRINGSTVVTMTASQNTQKTANAWVNGFQFSCPQTGTIFSWIDDWYMLDMTTLNSYLGVVQARGEAPTANSGVAGRNAFTPTSPTGVNYTNVGNNPPSASEYNFDSNPGDFDMFRYPTLPSYVTSVYAVQQWATLLLDSAGSRTVSLNCYSNGTDSLTSAFTPSLSASLYKQISTTNPNTSSAWSPSTAQAAELGIKVVS